MSLHRSDSDRSAIAALLLIVGVLIAECGTAHAQDLELPPPETLEAQCAPEVTSGRRQTLEVEGQTGLWFHIDVARCMANRLALLPRYARHVRLLEERLEVAEERDALRAREVALAVQEADAARGALEAAIRRAREAEEERDAWYRHPVFLVAVGVVLTVVVQVGAVLILREVE
jgi:hypothetical protein